MNDASDSEDEPYFKSARGEREMESEERVWREKLAAEFEHENESQWTGFGYNGTSESRDRQQETYGDWTDRIFNEYHGKQSDKTPSFRHSHHKHTRRNNHTSSEDHTSESKLKRERERMKRRYEEFHRRDCENRSKRRKTAYHERYSKLLGRDFSEGETLSFADLPWNESDSASRCVDAMLEGVDRNDAQLFKKRVKGLIREWHPDKFQQKFGRVIGVKTGVKITERVHAVSQELIGLLEKMKDCTRSSNR